MHSNEVKRCGPAFCVRFFVILAGLIAFSAVSALSVEAATVTNTLDSGAGSLREAIASTPAGGTVDFALTGCPCTIVLSSGELVIDKSLTITGPGAGQLSISGNNVLRIFRVQGPSGPVPQITVLIDALKIEKGRAAMTAPLTEFAGGGILAINADLSVRNAVISDNYAGDIGGGVHSVTSNTSIQSSSLLNNTAGVANSVDTGSGAGLGLDGGSLQIMAVTATGNRANYLGGVLYVRPNSAIEISDSSFSQNDAEDGIAAYVSQGSTATISRSTINANTGGGSIFENVGATMMITTSTISGNQGAAVVNSSTNAGTGVAKGLVTITGSTIYQNTDAFGFFGSGGVITSSLEDLPATTTLRNTIVAKNGTRDLRSPFASGFASDGFNLVGNPDAESAVFTKPGDQIGTFSSPLDPRLKPLALNGATLLTHALQADSPALDAGFSFGTITDERGFVRPLDIGSIGNAPGGDGSDIGAYEARVYGVSGRVSASDGRGLRNAAVTITDTLDGTRQTVLTSSLGFYSFSRVIGDRRYTISVSSKRYRFSAQTFDIVGDLTNIDFQGIE